MHAVGLVQGRDAGNAFEKERDKDHVVLLGQLPVDVTELRRIDGTEVRWRFHARQHDTDAAASRLDDDLCEVSFHVGHRQPAKAIVGAELQAITYNQWIPALLGPGALSAYAGYKSNVNPGIANEFSTAAFRLHSLINNDVEFFDNDGRALDEIELRDAFFNPGLIQESGIDTVLKYVASAQSEELDNQLVDGLRNFLFVVPSRGSGLDLATLNIQRGRDHGLADYNAVRVAYGLPAVTGTGNASSMIKTGQRLRVDGNAGTVEVLEAA